MTFEMMMSVAVPKCTAVTVWRERMCSAKQINQHLGHRWLARLGSAAGDYDNDDACGGDAIAESGDMKPTIVQ